VSTEHDNTLAWIERQDWPDAVKREARTILADRRSRGLHPLTGGAWVAFANGRGLTLRYSWQGEVNDA